MIVLDLSKSATRTTILEQIEAYCDDLQKKFVVEVMDNAIIPDKHHHDLAEIMQTIDALTCNPEIKRSLAGVYTILATAEAAAHHTTVDQAHFHEVGQAAGIQNALKICTTFFALGSTAASDGLIHATPVQTGSGTVMCAHGEMSIPTPATAHILEAYAISVQETTLPGELCTPTSAAILAQFVAAFDA